MNELAMIRAAARRAVARSGGTLDADEAESAAARGWLDGLAAWDGRGDVHAFAAMCAERRAGTAAQAARRWHRRRAGDVEEAGSEDAPPRVRAAAKADQEERVDVARMRAIIRRALRGVPARHRRALLAWAGAYGDGRTVADVARAEGVTRERARQWAMAAAARVRRALERIAPDMCEVYGRE